MSAGDGFVFKKVHSLNMTGSFSAWEITEKVQAPNVFPCLDSSLKGRLFYSRKGHLFL